MYGGVITGVTIGLPVFDLLNCFCCAGVLLGGLLSVFFYTRDLAPGMPFMTSNDALQLGALSGVFGAVIGAVLQTLVLASIGDLAREFISSLMMGRGMMDIFPPEFADAIDQMLMEERTITLFHMFTLLFIWLLIGPLFGLLGGLLGHAIFRPRIQLMSQPHTTGTNELHPPNPPGQP